MDEVGQLGGELFPAAKIPALVKYLIVRHELSHMLDYRKYGDDYYKLFTPAQREGMVLDRLKDNRIWNKLNDAERDWSLNYPSKKR